MSESSMPSPAESPVEAPTSGWQTVVHNDPVNLMTYVQWVFESYFGMDPGTAFKKMMQVHHNGRAVVSAGQREQMEKDAQALHAYGLWATIEEEAR
ncbi:ATP-dependent Clp protease adapter ClpS [Trueperella pecoris]|uniref:ATP-dependent Clp protease adapter protein ClpS n=2 Tax=Trueperella pecoris TaxID=2733571 RepID=A0A7M1QYG9_9ACTO|nr:ATP-dependent Clp protease adapter ClpS [Trueperella pecoris]